MVAAISYVAQVGPEACLVRATAAFIVFAAFGVVLRYLLTDAAGNKKAVSSSESQAVASIQPGTPVEELLKEHE